MEEFYAPEDAEKAEMQRQISEAYSLLDKLGDASITAVQLSALPADVVRESFEGFCLKHHESAKGLQSAVRCFQRFLAFAEEQHVAISSTDELLIRNGLNILRARGRTVPKTGLAVLHCAKSVFRTPWALDHAAIIGFLHNIDDSIRAPHEPNKAELPSEDVLIAIEKVLANSALPLEVRFHAGAPLLSAYVTKRWSCIQRLQPGTLRLSADAIHGKSWTEKRKPSKRRPPDMNFVASRKGLQLDDWAGSFRG